jgi:N-acylglucosamine 2-epimerase/mannose-6-phosphate isomerase
MFHEALPFWATEGLDRVHGGCVESLTPDGRAPSGVGFKRTRVLCRQIYVFSHAALLGWDGAEAACDYLYGSLRDQFWRGPDEGWPRTLTTAGEILDPTPDLYDYAFALFALAWRHRALGDADALSLAHQTLDIIERRFRHPSGLGFHHQLPPGSPRLQNPHMHLMEAALALTEADGDPRFAELADELAELFCTRLARFPDGVVSECFDDQLRPLTADGGCWMEPGHQFEWAWILAQHQKLRRRDNAAFVRALVVRAERWGVDPLTEITFNTVRGDGGPIDRGSRTWPNTERMKGWIGLYELTGVDPSAAVDGSVRVLLDRYLAPAPRGCWIDGLDANGAPAADELIPASTLYHLFLSFSEALRIAGAGVRAANAGDLVRI